MDATKLQLTIDGKAVCGVEGQTILAVALQHDIEIPNMCYDERTTPCETCGLCVCQVDGVDGLVHACSTPIAPDMVVTTMSQEISTARKASLERMLEHHVGDCKGPCMMACPAHTDCQGYVNLIAKGNFKAAIELVKARLPLAASLGRVCPHPCEDHCRRGHLDEAISIQWLKRFVADEDLLSAHPYMPPIAPDTGKSVGIIGGGPMGLSAAYFLRQHGHQVTIYENMPKAGGMLRYGIPEYRLPKKVLDREIELIEKMGVEIHTSTKVGTHITFEEMQEKFDAVIVSIGAWTSTHIGCPGEDQEGVIGGIDFLCEVALGRPVDIGNRVAIVGGGNTAMDACRTSVRLGSQYVYNIYRRTKEEMPADRIEIEEGDEEGVIFKNLCNPVKIVRNEQGMLEVTLQIMKQGEPDASGRRAPVPVEGEFELLVVNTVILATGQAVAPMGIDGLQTTRKHSIVYDKSTFMTNIPGVFAGGDCGNDKISIAVEAIADAYKASISINNYLLHENVTFTDPKLVESDHDSYLAFEAREHACRLSMEHLTPEERRRTFDEIVAGYSRETAVAEASRCLECGCHDYEDCKLIRYTKDYDIEKLSAFGKPRKHIIDDDKFIRRDPNKCISCGRCVTVCQELMCIGAQGILIKNKDGLIVPQFSDNLRENGCVGCGLCANVCPTGALEAKEDYKLNYWETEKVKTTCTYCGVGCQLNLIVKWGRVIGVEPVKGSSNNGMCCVKGKFAHNFIHDPERLKTPLIRKDGELVEATWEEALGLITSKIAATKTEFGPDSIAGFSSARVTNEENYLFQKFMRATIGTNNVDHCARLCHASTVTGLANTLGSGAMTNPLADVKQAEVIFITGSNTTEAHPVMGAYIRQAQRDGAKLIVADPKAIPLSKEADLYLQIKPGTSVALSNGMLHVIFQEGLEDKAYIEAHTTGVEELKVTVAKYTPEYTSEICGVTPDQIRQAARMYAGSKKSYAAYAMGITQHLNGTDNVCSISNLALATGNLGHAGCGINPLRGQNNVQGACDMGAIPADFPGYQKVTNPEIHAKFEKLWNTKLSNKPGYPVTATCDAILRDDVKILYVMGENPIVSDPDVTHVGHALEKVFLIVQDIFRTETAEFADVVLPAAVFAEKDGTFTNTERRVQRIRKAVEPAGEARADWQILSQIMARLGTPAEYATVEDVFNELRLASPAYCGITYDALDADGICWPCPTEGHAGTPILHQNGPVRGKGVFKAMEWHPSPDVGDPEYPITLMTGRVLEHYHTRTMTKRNAAIHEMYSENFIELNPADARYMMFDRDQMVTVTSPRGSVRAKVVVSKTVARGTAFMPFHFANGANVLTDGTQLDPEASIPGFKQVGIRLEP